jgi:hypothetical protein
MFEAWNKSRSETGSHLAFNMPEWNKANPMQAFQHTAYLGTPEIPSRGVIGKTGTSPSSSLSYTEGQTGTNPSTGQKWIFRGGKWVPQ